ncbi:MAG: SRPBCC family protein [Planctomycetota bacterium]
MQSTVEITIKRDVEDVWDFLADVKRDPEWIEAMSDVQLPDGGAFGPGYTFRAKYKVGGRTHDVQLVVLNCQRPDHITVKGSGPFAFESVFRCKPVEGGTTLSHQLEVGPDGCFTAVMFRLLPWIVRGSLTGQMTKELNALKTILESGS